MQNRALDDDGRWLMNLGKLVKDTKAKYDIHDNNMHNFDKTGFQMGIIGSMKVVTGADRCTCPELIQPGNCKWITVIQSIYAAGYTILPFIVYKGRIYISAWYKKADILCNWKLSVSENGWTNNTLGLE
jgi:hypothetical protein